MLEFLYFYPNWLIGLVFVGVALLASMTLMFGLRAVLPIRDDKDTFDITIRVMPTVLSLTAFVLGFSIVQANNDVARAARVVVDEATGIAQLDRLLVRTGEALTMPARIALGAYAKSIVADEWPYMRAGHDGFGHIATRTRVQAFNDALHAIEAGNPRGQELMKDAIHAADQIEDLRDSRLREARDGIPGMFWAVIVFLSLLMMSLGAFLRPTLTNIVMVASQAAAVGLLSAFLFMIDHPFMGESGLDPFMLERVISALSVKP